jgi:hypothetical protein
MREIKHVKVTAEQRSVIEALAAELSEERGSSVSLPAAVMEAVMFYRANRPKATV